MPNLAQPQRLCPGATQGQAAWGPTLTEKCYGAMELGVSNHTGGKQFSVAGLVVQGRACGKSSSKVSEVILMPNNG